MQMMNFTCNTLWGFDGVEDNAFDPYKALSQSTRLTTTMTYESATNELPLSEISFTRNPDSPDADKSLLTFNRYCEDQARNEMSPLATNERPLSCTCLPKLLTDNDDLINISQNSFDGGIDDEFLITESVLSASCPLPHGNFTPNENHIYSADFRERLNDYNAFREQKKSFTPRIFINDKIPKLSDLKSMQNIKLNADSVDTGDHQLENCSEHTEFTNSPNIIHPTKFRSISQHQVLKKPIVTSLPQLSSDPDTCNAFFCTKQPMISTTSNSTASNIVTNVNNTTIPHPNIVKIHNSDATQTTQTTTRRQRHGIAGQMGFFKIMDIAGGFSRKMATSTNSLFSTAVISGSSSAPNLHQINTTSPSVLEGFGGVPPIRPLETLHNALSLKQLDGFLEKMTTTTIFKTPASSPPKYPSTPLLTPTQTPQNSLTDKAGPLTCWSGQSSMTGSFSAMSSGGPSSPENSISRSELSASIVSDESINLPSVNELSQMFPKLDGDLGSVTNHFRYDHLVGAESSSEAIDPNELKTPLQDSKPFPTSTAPEEEDDEPTLSTDCLASQSELKQSTQQTSDGVISTATKLLEDIINNSAPKQQRADSLKHTLTRSPNLQVQKQISLHGSETISSFSSTKPTSNLTICDTLYRPPRRNFEYSRFMSVDQRSISDTEDNVVIESGSMKKQDSKTQSCANLKLSCQAPRSPGAIVVKEKYIELPKQVAQRKNSSGKEQQENTDNSKLVASSTESVSKLPKNAPGKPRFTTTKVDESQLGVSVLKEV